MYDKVKAIFAKAIDSKIPHYSDAQPLFRKTTTFENQTDETIVVLDRNNILSPITTTLTGSKVNSVHQSGTTYRVLSGREMAKEGPC